MGTLSTETRLTALSTFKKPFGKRKSSNVSTPSTSTKRLKQTNLFRFLTPAGHNVPITQPATFTKSVHPNGNPYQNPSISISDAQDIPELPHGLIVSKQVEGDGNCLLRAICLAHFGSQSGHARLRQQAIEYICSHPQQFIQDITFLCQCSLEDYCSRMSQNSVFGDDILLMACCILLGVKVQLYTIHSHLKAGRVIENLSTCTFSPVKGSTDTICIHLDTGDSRQVRQGNIVIRNEQIRAPHYDTLAMTLRKPLSDITNLPTNQITSAPTKRTTAAFSFPNIQKMMLNDQTYDASNHRESKDLERIE